MPQAADSIALLRALSRHDVAAENITRLEAALAELDARFRGDDPGNSLKRDERRLRPNVSHLESKGHKLLETVYGDLDVLGTADEDLEYADLVDDSVLVVLPVLRSTLERTT